MQSSKLYRSENIKIFQIPKVIVTDTYSVPTYQSSLTQARSCVDQPASRAGRQTKVQAPLGQQEQGHLDQPQPLHVQVRVQGMGRVHPQAPLNKEPGRVCSQGRLHQVPQSQDLFIQVRVQEPGRGHPQGQHLHRGQDPHTQVHNLKCCSQALKHFI